MSPGNNELDWLVRRFVYRHFGEWQSAPTTAWLAEQAGASPAAVEAALQRLAIQYHALALAPGSSEVWMAWPFSAVSTPYPVKTKERTYWANCAWDALSIPTLLGVDAATTYYCADCGMPIEVEIKDGALMPCEALVHFVVPARRFHDNVAYT